MRRMITWKIKSFVYISSDFLNLEFYENNCRAELKAQGLSDRVTTIVGSEFGRTISPTTNLGSDDGWGGNYFAFGGDVKGGKIIGKYPTSFSESYPMNIGRGRLIPSISWDSLWFGVAQWFGITDQLDLDRVLPNSQNMGCSLFADSYLFNSGSQSTIGCGGPRYTADVAFQIPEPRRLTGEEQKDICRLIVLTAADQLYFDPTKMRCYISSQAIQHSSVLPGTYDVYGIAILNFDPSIPQELLSQEEIGKVAAIAVSRASENVVAGAIITV